MNKKTILILEHNRVDYLYITLYALMKVNHIEDWDINVSIDGHINLISEFESITDHFSVNLLTWTDEVFNKDHTIRSLDKLFETYDEVILVDGADLIFRTDALDFLYSIDYSNYTFVNFGGWLAHNGIQTPYFYECRGNFLNQDSWFIIRQWMYGKKYIGMINPQADAYQPLIFTSEFKAFEPLMARYTRDKLGTTYFAPKPYSLHFGVNGISGKDHEVHNRMISGPKNCWLENVLQEHYNKTSVHFWPKEFIYK